VLHVKIEQPSVVGNWDNEKMLAQSKEMVELFEVRYPDCDMLLLVDQSANHHARVRCAHDRAVLWNAHAVVCGRRKMPCS
jgi:hypothetical protein